MFDEETLEKITMEILSELNYSCINGYDLIREDLSKVILEEDLISSIEKLNPKLNDNQIREVLRLIKNLDNNNTIRVEVIDHGIGIKESDLDLIWNKYYKVDKKHKRNKYGTGVGLSIVKSTMVNLGYNYGVLSKEGSGTTFYFEIKK